MSTDTKVSFKCLRRTRGIAAILLLATAGILVGRSVGAQQSNQPPSLGDLRSAPNINVLSALRWSSFEEFLAAADTVSVVRVDNVVPVKETSIREDVTGHDVGLGRADVTASVLDTFKGETSSAESFAFDAFFLPNSEELAIPTIAPPLESGKMYLVFLKDGRLLYPGGTYQLAGGKLWYIGRWTGADDRSYPGPISGLSVADAKTAITQGE